MSSLSSMSAGELSELLDEYGIKHGPVVGESHWTVTLRPFLNHRSRLLPSQASPACVELTSLSVAMVDFKWFYSFVFTVYHIYVVCVWLFLYRGSTRSLYERKLKEAMAKDKKERRAKPSPDKTYYREEGDFHFYFWHLSTLWSAVNTKTWLWHMHAQSVYSRGWKKSTSVPEL